MTFRRRCRVGERGATRPAGFPLLPCRHALRETEVLCPKYRFPAAHHEPETAECCSENYNAGRLRDRGKEAADFAARMGRGVDVQIRLTGLDAGDQRRLGSRGRAAAEIVEEGNGP